MEEKFERLEKEIDTIEKLVKKLEDETNKILKQKTSDEFVFVRVEPITPLRGVLDDIKFDYEHTDFNDDPEMLDILKRDLAKLEKSIKKVKENLSNISAEELAKDVIGYNKQLKSMSVHNVNEYPIFRRDAYFISVANFSWAGYHVFIYD